MLHSTFPTVRILVSVLFSRAILYSRSTRFFLFCAPAVDLSRKSLKAAISLDLNPTRSLYAQFKTLCDHGLDLQVSSFSMVGTPLASLHFKQLHLTLCENRDYQVDREGTAGACA